MPATGYVIDIFGGRGYVWG